MPLIRRDIGWLRSNTETQLKTVGLLDANGDPIAGGGGLPAGYDVEVAAAGDLATALAANTGVYVSGDISLTAPLVGSSSVQKRILFKPGVTVTIDASVGAGNGISAGTGFDLELHCSGEWTLDAQHTGPIFGINATAQIIQTGKLNLDVSANGNNFGFVGVSAEHFDVTLKNQAHTWQMSETPIKGTFQKMVLRGGGLLCQMYMQNADISELIIQGSWLQFNTGLPALTNYGMRCFRVNVGNVSRDAGAGEFLFYLDQCAFSRSSSVSSNGISYCVVGDGSAPAGTRSSTKAVISGADIQNKVYMPASFNETDFEAGSKYHTFLGCGFTESPTLFDNFEHGRFIGGLSNNTHTFGASFDSNDFVGMYLDGASTVTAGSKNNRFTNVIFQLGITLPANSNFIFVNCRFLAAVTVDAGAECSFIGCTLSTFTNNDPLNTWVANCQDVSGGSRYHNNANGKRVYNPTNTTDATQTELTIDGSNRFTLPADTTAIVNIKILAQRDNRDWASFQYLNCILAEDSGYTVTNGTASAGPDHSKGTGSSLVIALDAFSGLRIQGTGNAAENWKWQTEIEFVTATN